MQLMQTLLPAPDVQTDPSAAVHWQMGFGFGFTGLIWNLCIVVVAGADTAACASGTAWNDIESIRGRFVTFAFAQFLGGGIFCMSIGLLLYPFHSGHVLVVLAMILFPLAFWRAGLDLACTSSEFRTLKGELGEWAQMVFGLRRMKRRQLP